jgi:hypothetical protein
MGIDLVEGSRGKSGVVPGRNKTARIASWMGRKCVGVEYPSACGGRMPISMDSHSGGLCGLVLSIDVGIGAGIGEPSRESICVRCSRFVADHNGYLLELADRNGYLQGPVRWTSQVWLDVVCCREECPLAMCQGWTKSFVFVV